MSGHDDVMHRLLGTWKLVSATREDIRSGAKVDQMGSHPIGYINYAPDGRMLAIVVRADRTRPAGPTPTAAEAEALMRTLVSYGGRYTISGNEITHHVDISWNESWTGTKQTRVFKFDGERLHLSTRPSPDPSDGTMSVRHMVWEKVK
jgi:hypothetical protein